MKRKTDHVDTFTRLEQSVLTKQKFVDLFIRTSQIQEKRRRLRDRIDKITAEYNDHPDVVAWQMYRNMTASNIPLTPTASKLWAAYNRQHSRFMSELRDLEYQLDQLVWKADGETYE